MSDGGVSVDISELPVLPNVESKSRIPAFVLKDLQLEPIETIPETASCEFIEKNDGEIQDIVYTQNGNRASVRERYPGDYSVTLTRTTHEELNGQQPYNHFVGGEVHVTLIEGEEDDFNLSLLHELGHEKDEKTERKQLVKTRETQSLVRSRVMDTLTGEPLSPDQLKKKFLQEAFSNVLREEDRPELLESIAHEYQTYAHLGLAQRREMVKKISDEHMALRTRSILSHEQVAWLDTLREIRDLRKIGINVYGGTQEELAELINKGYSTNQPKEEPLIPTSNVVDSTPSKVASIRAALSRLPGIRQKTL